MSIVPRETEMGDTTAQVAGRRSSTVRAPSPGHLEALRQTDYLRRPGVRAIWGRLSEEQQGWVLDPTSHPEIGHCYPLSTREIATLTGLTDSRVRWWADHDQLPHGRTAGGHRTFGIAGLLSAFALSGSRQHELQFYRELADASGEAVAEKVDTLLFVLASRLEGSLSAKQQEQLTRAVLDLHEVVADSVAGTAGVSRRTS
jgi:hypothetical protein